MCVGLPGQVREVRDSSALVDRGGRSLWCATLVRPDVAVGDWVLVHAGLILDRISAAEAQEVLAALREAGEAGAEADRRTDQPATDSDGYGEPGDAAGATSPGPGDASPGPGATSPGPGATSPGPGGF